MCVGGGSGCVCAGRQDDTGDPDTGVVRPEYLSQNVECGSWSVNSCGGSTRVAGGFAAETGRGCWSGSDSDTHHKMDRHMLPREVRFDMIDVARELETVCEGKNGIQGVF